MAMVTKTAVVILDDASGDITYGDKAWLLSLLPQWYQGTSYWAEWTRGSEPTATMSVAFEGLAIGCIGNTPSRDMSQTAIVTIDGNGPYNISYGDPDPQTYMQWYQSPNLLEGPHTILFQELAAISLDMVLVTVGPNTSLQGKTLFIDNQDPQIQYTGTWVNSGDLFIPGSLPKGFPVHNSTHQSSTPGDTLTFRFSGTSVSVYGVFDWELLGNLSATYNLDGIDFAKSYPVRATSPGQLGVWKDNSNFVLFSKSYLEAGPHVLTITITQADNVVYALDYITYTPSFANLASQPDLSSLTIGQPTTPGFSFPTHTIYVNGDTNSHTTSPVGAILGGLFGSVSLLVLVLAFVWYIRKLKQKEKQRMMLQLPKPYADETVYMNDGYRSADIPPSRNSVAPYLLRQPTHNASNLSSLYGQERRYSEMRQFSDMSSIHPSHSASQVRYAPAVSSEGGETTYEAIAPYILEVSPPKKSLLLP